MTSKEEIKAELTNYEPTPEERIAIRSAMFNFITLATVGAAPLGMSARLWARSRNPLKPSTAIPTILGTFAGLSLGGALGMDRGMQKLRETLPEDSKIRRIIRETDQLRKKETLLSGPLPQDSSTTETVANDLTYNNSTDTTDMQLELIEDQLLSKNDDE